MPVYFSIGDDVMKQAAGELEKFSDEPRGIKDKIEETMALVGARIYRHRYHKNWRRIQV